MIEGIVHIGIIVSGIEETVRVFCATYNLPLPEITFVEHRNMKVTVIPFGAASLELVEDFNEESPLVKKVADIGPFIHHFALETDDIINDINDLEKKGCKKDGDAPVIGLRGKPVQFFTDKASGLSIELSEK